MQKKRTHGIQGLDALLCWICFVHPIMAITETYKLRYNSNFYWLNMYAEMPLLCCKSIQEKTVGRKGRNTNWNTQLGFPPAF